MDCIPNTRFMVAMSLLFVGAACDAPTNHASPLAQSDDGGQCSVVLLEQLLNDPIAYENQTICTEGIINVAYESMGIYPETGVPLPFHDRKLGPGINAHNASEAGFRSGDHVRAVGTLMIDRTCFGPDTLCPGGDTNSFYLRDSEIELTNPIAPGDVCEHFSLEDLPSDISSPAPRVVCTSGQYRNDGEGGYFLVPEQYAGSLDDERNFYLNYIWFGADIPDIAEGAWVEVVAVQFANELTVYDIVANDSAAQ